MTRIQAPKRDFHPHKREHNQPREAQRHGNRPPQHRSQPHAQRPPQHHVQPAQIVTHEEKGEPMLRYVPLGGMEQIGQNCAYFEYKDEIVMIDAGIQFPEEETPGVDYIIPNVSSLEPKRQNIRGIILTHGHYDHIHALPYIIQKIGNPIIYTAALTKALVEKRFEEFPNLPRPKIQIVGDGDRVRISSHFTAEFFYIDHTIPDAIGFILETPMGNMASFGDFRVERDLDGNPVHLEIFEKLGKRNIHTLLMDSTNADMEGTSVPEPVVIKNLEMIFENAQGRVIVATFASLLVRLAEIIMTAEKLGRRVAINGRSMKNNVEIAKSLGYMKFKKDHVIPVEEVNKQKDDKVLILSTGGQGEPNAGLTRIANGEHKVVRLKPSDTVVFSSSVVPGNERSVQALQDNIARQVDNVYNYRLLDIHSSGHCLKEDLRIVLKLVKPRNVIPIHGYFFKRKAAASVAQEMGLTKDRAVLMDNGQVARIDEDKVTVTSQRVPTNYVLVDGLGVGDVQEVVLRDRLLLADEGMVVVIVTIDRRNGRLLKTPDIISRGFIYLKDNQELLHGMRTKLKSLLERIPKSTEPEPDYVKGLIRDQIGQFLYTKTKRRPMVLPVLIEL
ncbi:RNase J family beta-CASP ribonuclease [Patescibacteria group bacterium]|nr:RNase J family beta-CASP ribonuclease [Patescibacteria group bacterium]